MRPPRVSSLIKLANNWGHYCTDSLINGVLIKVSPLLTVITILLGRRILLLDAGSWPVENLHWVWNIELLRDGGWSRPVSCSQHLLIHSFIHSARTSMVPLFLQGFALTTKSSLQIPPWHSPCPALSLSGPPLFPNLLVNWSLFTTTISAIPRQKEWQYVSCCYL